MSVRDFDDVIQQVKLHLKDYLEERGIDTSRNFNCPLPDHTDTKPSCNLVGADGDNPRIYCYSCGRSCDIFDLVQILEDKPRSGIEWIEDTLKYLAGKYNIPVNVDHLTEEQIYELDTYRAYRFAASLIKCNSLDEIKHNKFIEHSKRRGWNDAVLEELGVGIVDSYSSFREALKDEGFTAKFIDEIDLGRRDIFNENNMIFTWKDEKGRPVGFTSRNLDYEEQRAEAERNGEKFTIPKYNNQRTTGLKCNIFQKGKRLYGLDGALHANPPLYIFEGQTDVITARKHGLKNCVALAGASLNKDHVFLLKDLGILDLVIALDGDKTGRDRTQQILEDRLAGHKDIRVRVVIFPDGEDPDSFIREQGMEAFRNLACWTAFEWRLNQYTEADDPADIGRHMVPFIVNEPSPIIREQLVKTLSAHTGSTVKAITEELNIILDAQAMKRARERQTVLDKIQYELQRNPASAETILDKGQADLGELTRRYNADILSCEDFIKSIEIQKEDEEKIETSSDTGFHLGPDLEDLREALRGEWSRDVFMCFAGAPNVGKSGVLAKIAYSIAHHNHDVCVIYHTIDDTLQQFLPRFVSIAEGSTRLTMNMIRQPHYWTGKGLEHVWHCRNLGYERVKTLANDGRLVIKDVSHGTSLPFAQNLITYYQNRYPDRRVVYILDNVHKLRDFEGKDERVRFKAISEACKNLALKQRITMISSVEYTKLPPGTRPTNYNISESVQISYDANFIAHLYSEVADTPDNYTVCHKDTDWKGEEVVLPRVELIIGKNKITEMKGSLFLNFWPAASDFRRVSIQQVRDDAQQVKAERGQGSSREEFGFEEK